MAVYLDTKQDLEWLRDVHKVDITGIHSAILYGNEDWPNKIETFTENHYLCIPTVWKQEDWDDSGMFVKQPRGKITLDQWAHHYHMSKFKHLNGCSYVPDIISSEEARKDLYHLIDYKVSSVVAGMIWLVPVSAEEK